MPWRRVFNFSVWRLREEILSATSITGISPSLALSIAIAFFSSHPPRTLLLSIHPFRDLSVCLPASISYLFPHAYVRAAEVCAPRLFCRWRLKAVRWQTAWLIVCDYPWSLLTRGHPLLDCPCQWNVSLSFSEALKVLSHKALHYRPVGDLLFTSHWPMLNKQRALPAWQLKRLQSLKSFFANAVGKSHNSSCMLFINST